MEFLDRPLPLSALPVSDLLDLVHHRSLDAATLQQLADSLLADPPSARAFGVTLETVQTHVQRRVALLQAAYPTIAAFCQQQFPASPHLPTPPWFKPLWYLWLPLALHLADCRQATGRPWIQGVLGGQGTGKTTLGGVLTRLLQPLGYQTLSLSLDDLYKTHAERKQLRDRDPRLIWRGPPGTHDIALGIHTLDALRQAQGDQPIAIPRFDKSLHQGSGDRTAPEIVSAIDIVLFEGWFVGARPIDPDRFATAPAPLWTDADRAFARDMNAQLHDYLSLWERLDSLMVLAPVDYRLSQQWRKQAEHTLRSSGKPGMSDAEIDAFVEYFWKALHPTLFIQPLQESDRVDFVVELQADHTPVAIYRGGDRPY